MAHLPVQKYPAPRPVLGFEAWLEHWILAEDPWDYPEEFDDLEVRPTYAEYSSWVLADPQSWLIDRYTLDEAAECLSNLPRPSWDSWLPMELRESILRAERNVFVQVFEPRVGDFLSHCQREGSDLNSCCFMWWDNCAFGEPWASAIFRSTCERCLKSPSAAVQEAALHGLGHHILIVERDVEAVRLIDRYLDNACPELIRYARRARVGNVP